MNVAPTTMILQFLLSPEDTSAGFLNNSASIAPADWQLAKTVFWIALSIVAAMLIGQL